MAPKWSDELNFRFVELYKEHRCLWDLLDDLYKNKNARGTALVSIAESLNIKGFGAAEVKSKIKSFRGTYNIEMGKHKRSTKSGCGSADVYVPSLKWFSVMKEVMSKGTLKRDTKSTLDFVEPTSEGSNIEETEVEDVDDPTPTPEQINQKTNITKQTQDDQQTTSAEYQPKKKFKPRSKIQQIASTDRELKTLSESISRSEPGKEDEWDIYGRSVAAQLKRMSTTQALTAQMEINNVLTKCRFDDIYGGKSAAPNRLLSVSTTCHTSNSSDMYSASPLTEEHILSHDVFSTTPETSAATTFSEAFDALGYNEG
ncbi:hypothetical protein RI129_008455 [Pyrocoelia pectoralis]|uniref:MADF domain-containing protein n=1 Tax=Pyrocoelia pectoralis TaxID=417401 RepID=A0AAN7VB95_9COLE